MSNYRVYFKHKDGECDTKRVEADSIFDLIMLLDAEILYPHQMQSLYKIELVIN